MKRALPHAPFRKTRPSFYPPPFLDAFLPHAYTSRPSSRKYSKPIPAETRKNQPVPSPHRNHPRQRGESFYEFPRRKTPFSPSNSQHRPLPDLFHPRKVPHKPPKQPRLLRMDRHKPPRPNLPNNLPQLRRHHMPRTMHLVQRQPQMVKPVHKPFMVQLHLLVKRLRRTIDERTARARPNIQQLIHVIRRRNKNHLVLHLLHVLRRLHTRTVHDLLLPLVIRLLHLPVNHNIRVPKNIRHLKIPVLQQSTEKKRLPQRHRQHPTIPPGHLVKRPQTVNIRPRKIRQDKPFRPFHHVFSLLQDLTLRPQIPTNKVRPLTQKHVSPSLRRPPRKIPSHTRLRPMRPKIPTVRQRAFRRVNHKPIRPRNTVGIFGR